MSEEELREIFKTLEEQGWNPLLCDTPVPFYDTPVACGSPTELGDVIKDVRMIPKEFLSMLPGFFVKLQGDSMKDANIDVGDEVQVETNGQIHDGDIVLVAIDDRYTLKSICKDEDGTPWLVPQNEAYDAFPLEEQSNIWVIGKVTQVFKKTPRVSFRSCMRLINKAKQTMQKEQKPSPETVDWVIKEIAYRVKAGRQWYAVYRPLVEKEAVDEGDFVAFCSLVNKAVPQHEHLPTVIELQRMAVQSFRKPVRLWKPKDAPVQGKRFTDYQQIGLETLEMLEREM